MKSGKPDDKLMESDTEGKNSVKKDEGNTVTKVKKENLDAEEGIKTDGSPAPTESENWKTKEDQKTTETALQENVNRRRRKMAKPQKYVEPATVDFVNATDEPDVQSVPVERVNVIAPNHQEMMQSVGNNQPLVLGISNRENIEEKTSDENEEQHDTPDGGQEEIENPVQAGLHLPQEELAGNPRYGNRTFSTFSPQEQDRLRGEASRIHDGACFANYADFLRCFEAYKIVGSYPYRIASSELLRDELNNSRYKYRYVVFHCAHYGYPRKRGDGKRPNQTYLPSGCNAKFRVNFDPANGCVRISKFEGTHSNHDQSEGNYFRIIAKRRRTDSSTPKNSRPKKSPKGGKEDVAEAPNDNDVSMPGPSGINSNSIRRNSGNMPPENASPFQQVLTPATSSLSLQTNESTAAFQSTFNPLIQHMMIMGMGIGRRQERIQFIAANVYFLAAGQFLPQPLHYDLLYSMSNGNFHVSAWSDDQLSNVLKVFLQPPEVMLSDHLPPDISLNDAKEIRPEVILRAIVVIRDEMQKRRNDQSAAAKGRDAC